MKGSTTRDLFQNLIVKKMSFKYYLTLAFVVFYLRLKTANGETCGIYDYNPSTEICMSNTASTFVFCKQGYCRRSDNTCTDDESNCETKCKDVNERYFDKCHCLGSRHGNTCDQELDKCSGCTNQQLCYETSFLPCFSIVDICDGVDCKNGGTCVATDNGYECKCAPGYTGVHCELEKFGC